MVDHELIEQFRQGSADAFSAIVRRHVDWVYSAARRKVGDAHLAEDVTQAVFITLAQKMPHARDGSLSPWLFAVLIRISRDALKRQAIRQRHESEAAKMRPTTTDPQADWNSIAPNIEEAVARLRLADQRAILLRFYEQLSFAEVGATLGITEEAARKRVSRATEALRGMLSRRGGSMPVAALAGTMASEMVMPAPAAVITASSTSAAALGTEGTLTNEVASMIRPKIQMVAAVGAFGLVMTVVGIILTAQVSTTAPPKSSAFVASAPSTAPTTAETTFRQLTEAQQLDLIQKSLDDRDRALANVRFHVDTTADNTDVRGGRVPVRKTNMDFRRRGEQMWLHTESFWNSGDVGQNATAAWDGLVSRTLTVNPGNRMRYGGYVDNQPDPLFRSGDYYTGLMGILPPGERDVPPFREWLRSARSKGTKLEMEVVAGAAGPRIRLNIPEHELLRRTLFLDFGRDFMPVRYERRYELGRSYSAAIAEVTEAKQIGSVWLPAVVAVTTMTSVRGGTGSDQICRVKELRLGDVTDDDLKVTFPAGASVVDKAARQAYVVLPDGSHELQPFVDELGNLVEPETK